MRLGMLRSDEVDMMDGYECEQEQSRNPPLETTPSICKTFIEHRLSTLLKAVHYILVRGHKSSLNIFVRLADVVEAKYITNEERASRSSPLQL